MSKKQHDGKVKATLEVSGGQIWRREGGQHEPDLRDIPDKFTLPNGAVVTTEGIKFDAGKLRMDLLPPEIDNAIARILTDGADKYGERNWEHGMAWSRPYAALRRHLIAWWAGEDTDPESGHSHLWHVLTNAAFLVAYEQRGIGTDDRP